MDMKSTTTTGEGEREGE
ncbi:hypothetical protein AX774_g7836, partial [Zancudomyces culisetae]